jgi:hypothetical protein
MNLATLCAAVNRSRADTRDCHCLLGRHQLPGALRAQSRRDSAGAPDDKLLVGLDADLNSLSFHTVSF